MLLTEFLVHAIAQDEEAAWAALADDCHDASHPSLSPAWLDYLRAAGGPEALLAECEAKRHIITAHTFGSRSAGPESHGCRRCRRNEATMAPHWNGPCETLRLMAVVYADRPGYNPWWAPSWLRTTVAV
jgi:hypothetical protein